MRTSLGAGRCTPLSGWPQRGGVDAPTDPATVAVFHVKQGARDPLACRADGWAPADQVFLQAVQHQLAVLVVDAGGQRQYAGRALRLELGHGQAWIQGIPDVDRRKKAR